ncbi:MAG: hypothetical protein HYY52_02975 [Candidatus Melainabacteria bacterium]|nr:hypothetical protein [Candidatus Melainabacteria bacterium]
MGIASVGRLGNQVGFQGRLHIPNIGHEEVHELYTTEPATEVGKPKDGWVILRVDHVLITNSNQDDGIYRVEINPAFQNFATFNNKSQDLKKLEEELFHLLQQENVNRVIFSFNDCKGVDRLKINGDYNLVDETLKSPDGREYMEKLMFRALARAISLGKEFTIIHLEPSLYGEGKGALLFNSLVHKTLADVIKFESGDLPARNQEAKGLPLSSDYYLG